MNYCEQCGSANDIMNEQCYRCGHQFAPSANELVPTTGSAPSGQHATHDIGQGLELPDWLKRAAAETPVVSQPAPSSPHLPPPGFRVAGNGTGPTTDDLFRAEPPGPEPAARPLPRVPTAGLPNTIPDWLKSQSAQPPPTPEPNVTDTTSFITENDLPDWIRQIAEADAAKQLEDDRLAAKAAQEAESASPKRVVFPGESSPSVPAANPWLSRRDGASAARSWGAVETPVVAPAVAEVEPAAVQAEDVASGYEPAPVSAPAAKRGLKLKKPSIAKPALPKLAMPSLNRGSSPASSSQNMRVILLVALVVLLLIIVIGTLL